MTTSAITAQFIRPTGFLGWVVGQVMATRPSSRQRNLWTVSLLDIASTDRVLEIGFGPGLGIELAAERARDGLVAGLDHSCVMRGQALKRNRKAVDAGRVLLRTGGLDALFRLDLRFDKVFGVNVAHLWPDRGAALAAIRTVMKPGGTLALTYQPRGAGAKADKGPLFAERLTQELIAEGFVSPRTETLALKPYPAVCVLAHAP